MTFPVDRHLLLEGWKVSVDGYAAEVVDEGEVFWYISCCPVVEEAIQNTLVSSCNKECGRESTYDIILTYCTSGIRNNLEISDVDNL